MWSYLTTCMVCTILPLYFCPALIVRMNQFVGDCLVHMFLHSDMILAQNNLIKTKHYLQSLTLSQDNNNYRSYLGTSLCMCTKTAVDFRVARGALEKRGLHLTP
jgi:hypothetical protein